MAMQVLQMAMLESLGEQSFRELFSGQISFEQYHQVDTIQLAVVQLWNGAIVLFLLGLFLVADDLLQISNELLFQAFCLGYGILAALSISLYDSFSLSLEEGYKIEVGLQRASHSPLSPT
uniref:Uncharacterized protein n=1 Tax=Strombidium rassoulzadegani TaxID=1082188 RepID=A0A7S3FST4_9SPIT|mmetsp:Transcript_12424/g.20872  ORF Transcript_12424/g.20872 Transcript_12424/m.20872 type:complete len:120 (+) Transcript_12424:165-524(+)